MKSGKEPHVARLATPAVEGYIYIINFVVKIFSYSLPLL